MCFVFVCPLFACLCEWKTVLADPAVTANLLWSQWQVSPYGYLVISQEEMEKGWWGIRGPVRGPHSSYPPSNLSGGLSSPPPPPTQSPPSHLAAPVNWSHFRSVRGAGSARLSRLQSSPDLSVTTASCLTHQHVLIPGRQIPPLCHAPLASNQDAQGTHQRLYVKLKALCSASLSNT